MILCDARRSTRLLVQTAAGQPAIASGGVATPMEQTPVSPFQSLKMTIVENLHLAKDGIHIYLGVACFLLAIAIGRRSPRSFQAVLPGVVVSLLIEALDLRDDFTSLGHFRWVASLKDIINTNLIPLILLFAVKLDLFERRRTMLP
jgi:hypothetical protein